MRVVIPTDYRQENRQSPGKRGNAEVDLGAGNFTGFDSPDGT
jgi:hypothetical protein